MYKVETYLNAGAESASVEVVLGLSRKQDTSLA